jgi:hypothetical protein
MPKRKFASDAWSAFCFDPVAIAGGLTVRGNDFLKIQSHTRIFVSQAIRSP